MGGAMGARKALCKPRLALSETKLALLPGSAAHPVQNSPSKPQNADFGPLFACRENFVPLPPPTTRAGRTLSRMRCHFRYKTLPASGLGRPTRYKTLPAARLGGPPGTKLSQQAPKRQFRPTFRMQGELFTASATNNPSRENFLPLPPPTTRAGRTLYRFRHQQPEQGELYPACGATSGTKLSQRARLGGPPGTKLSQQAPKRRFRPTFRMQGELCTASATNTTSRANNFAHQHPTAPQQRAPLQISHAIRLNELSTKPRNVAIPTT